MFIVYLNVCLDIAIRIFIGMVKKTCSENFSSLGTGHYLWQGWGPKRKYNAAGKNHYPTFFETKFPATPPVECWKIFLPHPNLFCCNVKRPDIKYVI
jgi:hypothetical protein